MKEQYIHSVRILMDCPPAEKERLISRLNNALTTYLEDVPNAAEEDLTANFGSPEDCAARLLEECTPKEVIAERQKRVHHQRILVAVLAVLLTVALSVALYLWSNGGLVIINTSDTAPDYYVSGFFAAQGVTVSEKIRGLLDRETKRNRA